MKRSSMLVLLAVLVNLSFTSAWSSSSSGSSSSFNVSDWTPSTRNCSTQETIVMRKLYIGVAAHTACANESTVDKYEVEVRSECRSLCTPVLQNLEEALPDCNYYLKDYENSNKKWEAYASLAHCDQRNASDPVAVRFHSNSTITILTPSSASGSAVMDEVSMSSNSNSDFVDNSPAMGTQMSWIGAAFIAAVSIALQF
ncbi:hypothetical protein F442_09295 [Phytophthora nicotianae P10297]|uniref:Elicitin n=3 Tax=Phytophthora nicotianae TaxID=4792 RepID=W2ZAT7_PHYNI|nr:hypothetical protein L916_09106 [Phytophthora nicotianae]ETL92695.1 hypothetical protein L917_09037 [Phytophthora nicotianae]ETO74889.1 hypothetical protein F444_09459 [Phytophthora nicotianae P1976]ETP44081.1 hypothetical protein F442_09295 [Phytophthora nicotianae P10297]